MPASTLSPTVNELRQRLTGVKSDLIAALSLLIEQNGGRIDLPMASRPEIITFPVKGVVVGELAAVYQASGAVVVDTDSWTTIPCERIPSQSLLHILEAANRSAANPLT